jgi:hypothetical protein
LITEFGKTLPTSPGLCLCGGRLLYFCSNAQKYISAMPNGYKTDMVMFFEISRTLQRKQHTKWMSRAPRNDPTTSPPQKIIYIKNGFGLVSL